MHEMGHVFDLGHSDVADAIMYPTYDGKHTTIVQDDIDGLQRAWGKIKRNFVHLIPPAAFVTEPKVVHIQYQLPKKSAYKKRALAAINQIVIHHSADNGTPESIASYHVSKGWPGIGYHYVIAKDGTVYHTNDIDEASYNVAQQNTRSLGICLIGNYEKDTPPDQQVASLKWLVKALRNIVGAIEVVGHRDRVATACPGKNLYEIVKTLT
jgi:N-acetyl-anhydromuramyl-L-alanine amidase AmpD